MDLTFQVNIALYSIEPCFYHQSYPQLGVVFALAPSLHSFWSYFSTIFSSILGTYRPGEILFQYPIILPFHTAHEVLKARIPKRFAIPFSSGPHSVSYIYFIKLNEFPGSVPVPDFPVYDSGHFSPAALHASLFLFILNSAIYLLSHIVVSAWRYEFSHGH